MSQYVLDASVIIKWLIPENPDEHNVAEALALLSALRAGTIVVRQPFHWLAEVAAVGVRLKPDTIVDDIADLQGGNRGQTTFSGEVIMSLVAVVIVTGAIVWVNYLAYNRIKQLEDL